MSEQRKVLRAAGLIGALTLLSRCTGLIRDSILAAKFGGSRFSDVFLTAFEPTNMLRRMLGEGALSSFIVPLLTDRRHSGGEREGWRFFNQAANLMLLVALAATLLGGFFSREVFLLFGGLGLKGAEAQFVTLGAHLTRIMFPYVVGLTLASLMMGACHTLRSFGPPTLGSVMLNLAMIAAGLAALALKSPNDRTAVALAWSVLAGVALRVLLMVPTLRRAGWRWRPELSWRDPHLRKLMWMMLPGLLALAIAQLNIVVSGFFAMYLGPGAKTYIRFSNQLIQFPLGLTATAAATAMLPQLALYLTQGRLGELRELMSLTKRLEIILMMPAMLGLIVLGLPIVELVFQRHAWREVDSLGAYKALIFYAPGLLPLGWVRLIEPLFYARADRVTPLKAASASMLVNVALNWFFGFHTPLAQGGLALANTLAAFTNYFVLSWSLHKVVREPLGARPRIGETLWKTALAALAACAIGWAMCALAGRVLGEPGGTMTRALRLGPVLALVGLVYFALARWLRVPDLDRAEALLLKKFRKS